MALGKQAVGCALWPGGLRPYGLMGTSKQAHGGTHFASCGHPWALRVPRKRREGCIARGKGLRPSGRIDSRERGEGAPLRGFARGMRPHRRADGAGGLQRSTKRATIVLCVASPECGCTGSPDPRAMARGPTGTRSRIHEGRHELMATRQRVVSAPRGLLDAGVRRGVSALLRRIGRPANRSQEPVLLHPLEKLRSVTG
jgi:hypothetical protein